jgi:sulfite reductase (NADPH) hemoprotein beta-component
MTTENTSAAAPKPPTKNEFLKAADPTLAGNIGASLADTTTDRFSEDDEQFLKFHGIYQQDDRDKRKTGKYYMTMIRARIPAGVVKPEQYLVFDKLSADYGNNTLRLTSRQSVQWHGVVKGKLGPLMKELNEVMITTLAACGDVNRNVMAPSTPATGPLTEIVIEDSRAVSDALLPTTPAYHQIWVEGQPLRLSGPAATEEEIAAKAAAAAAGETFTAPPPASDFTDPLYGKTYLPRKFKTAFAIPPLNDVDVFTNCLGFIAIADPANPSRVLGYNLLAGGGLGMSHGNKDTFPRVADVIGFFPRERLVDVARAVVTVHRDFGDRTNRKHARLKYVLAEKGAAWFRAEIDARTGFKLEDPRPWSFTKQGDLFGWHRQLDGKNFLGLYVEAGRIQDTAARRLKTALREIARRYAIEFRITPSQNLILSGVADADRDGITNLLSEHGIPVVNQAGAVRRASMACPSMPTCGLGLAESERFLPTLLDRFEQAFSELGISDDEVIIRMTGCPNGCARPFMAEIGLIGRAPNKYNVYVGGNEACTRLARTFQESVKGDEVVDLLKPVLTRWRDERLPGERFGDFCVRTGIVSG